MNGKNTTVISIAVVFTFNILSKGAGFIREMMLASFYGASSLIDAYLMAGSIVNIFMGAITAFTVIYIPRLARARSMGGREYETAQFCQLIVLVTAIISIFIFVFNIQIISLVANGFSKQDMEMTRYFMPMSILSLMLNDLNLILLYNLNYHDVFIRANVTQVLTSLVQIVCVWLSNYYQDINFLNISNFMAALVQTIILAIVIKKLPGNIGIGIINIGFIKKVSLLTGPIIMSAIIDDINVTVDKAFASNLSIGTIASLNYAHLLKQVIFFVFITSLISVLYPKIARYIEERKIGQVNLLVKNYMLCVGAIMIPCTIIGCCYANDIVHYIYERGAFSAKDTLITAQLFMMYIIGLLALSFRELFQRILYSFHDTKSTFYINALMSIINIVLNCILIRYFGANGLAFSTAMSAYLVLPLYWYVAAQKGVHIDTHYLGKEVVFMLACSVVSIIPIHQFYVTTEQSLVMLLMTVMLTVMIYIILFAISRKSLVHNIIMDIRGRNNL